MNYSMVVHLIVNIDAIQFKVSNSSDGRVKVKYIVDGGRPAGLKSVADTLWPILLILSSYIC